MPSGGDWSLYHGAALEVHGVENVSVRDCRQESGLKSRNIIAIAIELFDNSIWLAMFLNFPGNTL